ncbi:MAG: porin [Alteraurantiacibacter sp.]
MSKTLAAMLLSSTLLIAPSAHAQDDVVAALRAQITAMQAQIDALSSRLDGVEVQTAATEQQVAATSEAIAAVAVATTAAPVATTAAPAAPPAYSVAFRGGPEVTAPGGWSFKPRGRLQVDAGLLDAPAGITDRSAGFGSEFRRLYLGVDGKIPGGFGYRVEADFANSTVELTDVYLTYQASSDVVLTVGQMKPFWGLEEMTSDLFTSFTERAAVNTAFGFERRLGVAATYSKGPLLVQGGVFTDNVADLNNDENNSLSFNGRVVFAPQVAGGTLHLGGSANVHNLNNSATTVRYRTRPFAHTADLRFVDTGNVTAVGENGYGLELAYNRGPFHVASEYHWQHVRGGVAGTDATFDGAYIEAGLFLTQGDTVTYRGGAFDRTRPRRGIDAGGPGAWQVNLRYDTLDLTDLPVRGGTQDGYSASLVWVPTDYTRVILNYGHLEYRDAFIALTGGGRDYSADAFGLRGQFDF